MELITEEQRRQLIENWVKGATGDESHDPVPVVKLFTPDGAATWLLTELNPGDESVAFGLADLGFGCPEIGYIDMGEIRRVNGQHGLPVERDLYVVLDKPLSEYAASAQRAGHIIV